MALFPLSGVLRGFTSAKYEKYVSTQTLVRHCSEKKLLIYGLETYASVHGGQKRICGWTQD
jgi:hypothetical protein